MNKKIQGGVYPVMLTPFKKDGEVDYNSLIKLTKWYEQNGADGLFAICQSSEIFKLSLEEKIKIVKTILANTNLPVVASGNTQDKLEVQLNELKQIANTGVDAIVLITNRFAKQSENDDILIKNLQKFLDEFNSKIPLGLYECPYPYKRLLSKKVFKYILDTNRFIFLKDTSCDMTIIKERIDLIGKNEFGLYNAHAHTLVESLVYGAKGYSGIHANFSTKLSKYIYTNYNINNEKLKKANQLLLEVDKVAVENGYPVSAKYVQKQYNIFETIYTRVRDNNLFNRENEKECSIIINKIKDFEGNL